MKTIFIPPLLLLLSFCVNAQNNESIIIGKKEIIYYRVLNENRKIWIYAPNITSQSVSPDKRYPTI